MSKSSFPVNIVSAGLIPLLIIAILIVGFVTYSETGYGAQQTQQPVSDVRANRVTTADQHEPSIAVDPTNSNNVLAASKDWRTGPKQVWHYRSTDGGGTWADGHIETYPSELPNQSDPCLAFSADGTAYLSVLGYNQNDFSIGGVFVSRSNDKGATWQKPVGVASNSEDVFNDKEWLTTDNSNNATTKGNLYVSWTQFSAQGTRDERADIVVSRSTDGGKTFSPAKQVSLPEQSETQGSFPAVGPNGELYVLYFTSSEGEGGEALYIAKSTDGGQTFAPARKAADVAQPPSPLPGSKFRMFVLPALAVDPTSGALYATWNDYANGDTDVTLVGSTDGGQTWSAPKRVNDDPARPRYDQFFPAVKVGPDGSIHLLWLDRRDDPDNVRYAPYYARSTDGGRTFSKNLPVSRVSSDPSVGFEATLIGDYISLDLSADSNTVYAAWCDTREGNQDIYFAQFPAQSGPLQQGEVSDYTSPTPEAVPSPQPLTGFTDEAFVRRWERADRPVALGRANRPWLWGPGSFAAAEEAYEQGLDSEREVLYFDKARMEINDPSDDPSNPYYVTNGLLAVELISGRVQRGDQQFESATRPPSQVPAAGDVNSPDALTYASLAPVTSLNNDKRASDRTGQPVTATLNRNGQVGDDPLRAGLVNIAVYEQTIGHNIPNVFWNYMNATGPVYNGQLSTYSNGTIVNWARDLGYPITEPYWTNVKIGGAQKWVLVQAFQRRVLTYVPDNAPDWRVEMGNVGRHYFDWRYGR